MKESANGGPQRIDVWIVVLPTIPADEKEPGPRTIPEALDLAPDHSLVCRQQVVPATEQAGSTLASDDARLPPPTRHDEEQRLRPGTLLLLAAYCLPLAGVAGVLTRAAGASEPGASLTAGYAFIFLMTLALGIYDRMKLGK